MMHLSQPALSQLISNLELETGLTLFRRERRRLHPTKEAFLLSQHAEDIFSGLRHVERISKDIRNKKIGTLNVASVMMLGREFLPRILSDIIADKPGLAVNIGIKSHDTICDLVAGRSCDVGFGFWHKPHSGITVLKSYKFPMVCVLPINDPLAEKNQISLSDFEGRTVISLSDGSRTQGNIDRLFAQVDVSVLSRLSVQQTELACEFVARGCGIAIVNPFSATEYALRGKLCAKPLDSPLEIEVSSFVPVGTETSLIAQEFLDKSDRALVAFSKYLADM